MGVALSWRWLLPLVALPCAVTCYGATEIRVALSTDACQRSPRVAIYSGADVQSARAAPAVAVSNATCDGSGGLGDLVFVPSGSKDEHVVIVVLASFDGSDPTACPADGSAQCVVARRSARYSRHRSLDLPMLLSERCLNVVCPDPNETCVAGKCESAVVDDNPRLADPAPPPSTPGPDASPPGDGSTLDAPDLPDAPDSGTDTCLWGNGTHSLPASKPVGGIASNTADLYWVTATGAIARIPKNGTTVLSATNASLPSRILVDDVAIYLGATAPTPRLRRLAFGSPLAQAVDMSVLSFTQDSVAIYAATAGSIDRVVKSLPWQIAATVAGVPLDGPQSVAVAGPTVYWIEADRVSGVATSLGGQVTSEYLSDPPIAIAADQGGAVIALSPKATNGGIVRYTTGQPTVLVSDPGITDDALVIDGSAIYFTRKLTTGTELRRLENGMSTVVDMPGSIRGLVVDGPCLYYWAGPLGTAVVGSIMKQPKP